MNRVMRPFLLIVLSIGILAGCAVQRGLPVYRIGIITPLEGGDRTVGLDVFFASRAALLNALEDGSMSGYRVELVTVDDFSDPVSASRQAAALSADPAVLVVIGHWQPDTTTAALPVYDEAGLPLITAEGASIGPTGARGVFVLDAPPATYADRPADQGEWTNTAYLADLPGGDALRQTILEADPSATEPGRYAGLAYDATTLALAAIQQAAGTGNLNREGVAAALQGSPYSGITGEIAFDGQGFRIDAPLYHYAGQNESAPVLLGRFPEQP